MLTLTNDIDFMERMLYIYRVWFIVS